MEFCFASPFGSFIEIILCLKSRKLFSNSGRNKLVDRNMVLVGKRPYSVMQGRLHNGIIGDAIIKNQ